MPEAESGRDGSSLTLGRVTTLESELVLGAAEARHVALARVFFHRDAQLLEAGEVVVDVATREHVRDGGASVVHAGDPWILRQVSEATLAHDFATRRLGFTAEHLEQARLARTVPADEADLVLGHHGERGVLDDEAATDLDVK